MDMDEGSKGDEDLLVIGEILKHVNEPVIISDTQGKILLNNDSAVDIFGDSLKDRLLFDIAQPDEEPESETSIVKTCEGDRLCVHLCTHEFDLGGEKMLCSIIKSKDEDKDNEEFLHSLLRHDLRNKLQVLHGYLQLLEDTELQEPQSGFLDKALSTMDNCRKLIETVRLLRKLKNRESLEVVNIDGVIDQVQSEMGKNIEDAGIEFIYQNCEAKVLSGSLLNEVFINLIDNAIKHAECSKIIINVSTEEKMVNVSVEDDGAGIPKELRGSLFKEGEKGKMSSGSGIGLSLAHRIITDYGGTIDVCRSSLGGACFKVKLQRAF